MSGKSNYLENKLLDFIFRGQAFSNPVIYVALLTSTKGPIARSTTYSVNDTATFIASGDSKCHLYKCTAQSGATAGSAPSFPGVANEVITDGGVTWTEQDTALRAGTACVEPSGGAYARVKAAAGGSQALTDWQATQGGSGVSSGTTGLTSNTNTVTFPSPSGANWGFIWGFGIYDALSSGNLLYPGGLSTPKTVNNGDAAPTFAASAVTVTET